MRVVTAAVIVREGLVLLARRAPGLSNAGLWEFPGGKLEPGEDERECLEREIREELGIEGAAGEFVGESRCGGGRGILLRAYWFEWRAGELRLSAHDAVRWAAADELEAQELTPADVPLARRVASLLARKSGE